MVEAGGGDVLPVINVAVALCDLGDLVDEMAACGCLLVVVFRLPRRQVGYTEEEVVFGGDGHSAYICLALEGN